MKKVIALLCTLTLLAGCSSSPVATPNASATPQTTPGVEAAKIKVLSPTGAPALSTLSAMIDDIADITYVDGTDVLQAAFVNPNPEYDVIIAPSNLGAKLAEANKTEYRMEAVVTWGNLYVVAESENAMMEQGTLAAFGENAVPQIVFDMGLQDLVPIPEVVYYNSVAEAQAALLSGKATAALLAEPLVTATIAKAKEKGKTLSVIWDLQEQWKSSTKTEGYPQAAIFVRNSTDEKTQAGIERFVSSTSDFLTQAANKTPEELIALIDQVGADQLGVPSSTIVAKTWAKMNLRFSQAKDVKPELETFLGWFNIADIDSILASK